MYMSNREKLIWKAVLKSDPTGTTISTLADEAGVRHDEVQAFVTRMARAGFIDTRPIKGYRHTPVRREPQPLRLFEEKV